MLSEWQLELPGVDHTESRRPFLKREATLSGPYDTGRIERAALNESTPFVLLNAESSDAGSPNYASAYAACIAAIHKATGAKVAAYWHFHWGQFNAAKRWANCRDAFRQARAWPSHIVVSGHWRVSRQVADLVRRVELEIAQVRRIEPYAPIAVLTCPYRYLSDDKVQPMRPVQMNMLHKVLLGRGYDIVNWYEPKHMEGRN